VARHASPPIHRFLRVFNVLVGTVPKRCFFGTFPVPKPLFVVHSRASWRVVRQREESRLGRLPPRGRTMARRASPTSNALSALASARGWDTPNQNRDCPPRTARSCATGAAVDPVALPTRDRAIGPQARWASRAWWRTLRRRRLLRMIARCHAARRRRQTRSGRRQAPAAGTRRIEPAPARRAPFACGRKPARGLRGNTEAGLRLPDPANVGSWLMLIKATGVASPCAAAMSDLNSQFDSDSRWA